MALDWGTALGLGALGVSVAGAINSLRATRVTEHSATSAQLEALNEKYLKEITRLELKVEAVEKDSAEQLAAEIEKRRALAIKLQTTEDDCKRQLVEMRETISSQAQEIAQLKRKPSTRTRASDAG